MSQRKKQPIMKTNRTIAGWLMLLALSTLNLQLSTAFAQGTAFTYQGQLNSGGSPANGIYNLTFSLFNTNSSGAAIAVPVTNNAVVVTNGLFTVLIDFGPGVFTGQTNWLQIGVETNGVNTFTTLAPRQQLTPAPYAVFANTASNLSGTLPVSQVGGVVPLAQLPAAVMTNGETGITLGGTFNGNATTATTANNFSGSLSGDVTGTQSATVVSTVGGQTAANVAGGASAANAATSANTANTIVKRDATGSFSATNLTLNSGLNLPSVATIYSGGNSLLHDDLSGNFFAGVKAGSSNTSGSANTANGYSALGGNTLGNNNTAEGNSALYSNTNGNFNTASGYAALFYNTNGSYNIGLGFEAGMNVIGSSNIDIGNFGVATDTNIIRIGSGQTSTFIAGVINGNGGGLTNLNAASLSGTFTGNVIGPASTATNFSGSLAGDVTGLQSATVVSTVGGQTAANVASGASAANAATNANTANTIVKRDASGSFTNTSITLNGNLNLPATTASAGIIYSGGSTLIQSYGTENFFAGSGAGNLTMQSTGGNTGIGRQSLKFNTSGNENTGLGDDALFLNTSGSANTAVGYWALLNNTNGNYNIALGVNALYYNLIGSQNIAIGYEALYANTTGSENIGMGYYALLSNTNGSDNVALSLGALQYNTSGSQNIAIGRMALCYNTNGNNNIALGYQAGYNITTGSSNIDIGNLGLATDTNIIRIGSGQTSTYIAGAINGNGGGLTNLNASQISTGTIPLAQLPAAVVTNNETGITLGGTFNGNATTATTANNFSGSLSGDVTGTQSATVVSSVGGQSAANVASGASAANAATNAATPNTIVKRDAGGSFTTTNITLNGSLVFSNEPAAIDTIYSGGSTLLIDDYDFQNFYVGFGAGSLIGLFNANYRNVGVGYMALPGTSANCMENTAIGNQALYYSEGEDNTAIGNQALYSNLSDENTAIGSGALFGNADGYYNTASGAYALVHNNADGNTAIGNQALYSNTNGTHNIALGYQAGYNITSSNNIDIGNEGVSSDNGVIRIGTSGTHNTTYLTGVIEVSSNQFMNDQDIQLRNDLNQGVGWYGAGKLFSGVNVDGPVLYGYSGGGLGYHNNNYGTNLVLYWNNSGHVGIGNTSPGYLLVVGTGGAYCNGTTWVNGSDRNSKEDFAAVNPREVLAKVSALPITQWKYKLEPDGTEHLGPMAQDFHAAFGLDGADDTHIATVDESGVALAAIQGLNQKLDEKDAEIQDLKQSVAELKQMVQTLAERK
jgi:hypothetical protein